jgi:hypothetical protein
MTMPSSARALRRRAEAVTFAGQTGQSTGALLRRAGVVVPGLGLLGDAPAGQAFLARRRSHRPSRNVAVRSRAGH